MSIPANAETLLLASQETGGYQLSRSLRFSSGDTPSLSRSLSSAPSTSWTLSLWVKRSALSNYFYLFSPRMSGSNVGLSFHTDNKLRWYDTDGTNNYDYYSTAVFRDVAAWYHIVMKVSSGAFTVYVNNTSYLTANLYAGLQSGTWYLGANTSSLGNFDGYIADAFFIDGQALDPSSFAETDATTGAWNPKTYTGSYGTQGWHLEFADNSAATATTLGKDTSGNGNNWTPNNFQVTSTPNYSSYLTNSYTLTNAAYAFDSSTATYAQDWNGVYNANYNYEIIFTPPTPISFTSQVRIFGPGGPQSPYNNRYAINLGSGYGSDVSSVQNGWVTMATGSGSITAIRSRSDQNGCFIGAIEIDGVILQTSPASGIDSLVDSPTNYGTDTGAGGEVRGNYATFNPLQNSNIGTLANGNLQVTGGTSAWHGFSTIAISSGKWYCEFTGTGSGASSDLMVGIVATNGLTSGQAFDYGPNGYGYRNDAKKINNNTTANYGATYAANDVIGVAFDADGGTLTFYKNGSSQGTAFSSISSANSYMFAVFCRTSSETIVLNAGQRPFAYTAPSGFKALCTQNLPTPTILKGSDYFDTKLYTGNGSTQTISGLGFSPDFLWIKSRSTTYDHQLADVVRGVGNILHSNLTAAESTLNTVTATTSTGFTVDATSYVGTNANGQTFAAWCWDAGSSNATNTQGSITSSVRANATAGFSIVSYTGNATNGATVGHGLGIAPAFFIIKKRSATSNWTTYHQSLGAGGSVFLNLTDAYSSDPTRFNSTAPSSTVVTLGAPFEGNTSGATYVMYCFAPVAGYSSFGSYTGNGSTDGPFVYTGFRPRWIMTKRTDTGGTNYNWFIYDAVRDTYNVSSNYLEANLADVEKTYGFVDLLSNGFKIRNTSVYVGNASGGTYIYAAFAESPFNYSRAR